MANPDSPQNEDKLPVRRGRVASVDLYEVKEHELELLEKGSAGTLQFNFSIFLFSIALTCIATLVTADFKWDLAKTIFTFITVIGPLFGGYLMLSWWQTRTSLKEVVSVIRGRLNGQASDVQIIKEHENQHEEPKDNEESDA